MSQVVCEFCGSANKRDVGNCISCGSEIREQAVETSRQVFIYSIPTGWPASIWVGLVATLLIAGTLSLFTEKPVAVQATEMSSIVDDHTHDDSALLGLFQSLKPDRDRIRFALEVADSLQEAGHPHAAATWGEMAYQLDTLNVDLALRIANWHYDAGDRRSAIPYYRNYLRVFPNNWDVRVDLATALMEGDSPMESVRELKAVLSANPNHQVANLNLGVLQTQIGNLPAADSLLKKAKRINPSAPAGLRATELLEIIHKTNN